MPMAGEVVKLLQPPYMGVRMQIGTAALGNGLAVVWNVRHTQPYDPGAQCLEKQQLHGHTVEFMRGCSSSIHNCQTHKQTKCSAVSDSG